MNVTICDDNALHLNYARSMAERCLAGTDAVIYTCTSLASLSALADSKCDAPDIAILDIELADGSGIEAATRLNRRLPKCQIIFLSSYPSYASDAYDTSHVWFVLKNRAEDFLPKAIQRAVQNLQSADEPAHIVLRQRQRTQKLPADRIYYLERIMHQTRIVTADGESTTRQTPAELLQTLAPDTFIRCHQSYWVNTRKIRAYADSSFHLADGTVIPVSRTYKKAAVELLHGDEISAAAE